MLNPEDKETIIIEAYWEDVFREDALVVAQTPVEPVFLIDWKDMDWEWTHHV